MKERRPQNGFLAAALGEMSRLLAQLNRNPASRSYGSFDRAYWHYRTNDISCARYQEAAYTLGLLYACDFEGNEYYQDFHTLELVRAALRFTVSIQRRDGSFDEWYPNEGSYVATAFVASALAQLLMMFREERISIPEERVALELLERAARFLMRSSETAVLNQVSGAIFAIAAAGRISEREEFVSAADVLLERFLAKQSPEGWWSEYGGPDAGYLSLTVSYLEKYGRLPGAKDVSGAIERAKSFILQFVHPDGTVGGEYLSRNTEYLIPSRSLPYLGAVCPAHLDDRYLCYILYNWVETGLELEPLPLTVVPGERYFPESGLLRVASQKYLLVANASKGGSLRVYAGGKAYYDSGLEIMDPEGAYSTGILDGETAVRSESGKLVSSGSPKRVREPLLRTPLAIAFKAWQLTLGRLPLLRKLVKGFLRARMISYRGSSTSSFERVLEYGPDSIAIYDRVRGPLSAHAILAGSKASYAAVPSAKYAAVPITKRRMLIPKTEESRNSETYSLLRTFSFDT